jgi:hypothetical protein
LRPTAGLFEGLTAIAEALYLGEATVKAQINHLPRKLEARDRAQLVVIADQSRPGAAQRRIDPSIRTDGDLVVTVRL